MKGMNVADNKYMMHKNGVSFNDEQSSGLHSAIFLPKSRNFVNR